MSIRHRLLLTLLTMSFTLCLGCNDDSATATQSEADPKTQESKTPTQASRDSLTITVTSNKAVDTLSTQKLTLTGTIDNPLKKTTPLTEIRITQASGSGTKKINATIIGDSSFTTELVLDPGSNLVVLVPVTEDRTGAESVFMEHILKAKGVRTDVLQLRYDAKWTGRFDYIEKTTTLKPGYDSSRTVSTVRIVADMDISFSPSKLAYIVGSHENAVACSELSNCYIFGGSRVGPISVTGKTQTWSNKCDHDGPLDLTYQDTTEVMLEKYTLTASAILSPWDSVHTSSDRQYYFGIFGNPDISINYNDSWPKSSSQTYDCSTKAWVRGTGKVGPMMNLKDSVLKFLNAAEVESYVKSPTADKMWAFAGVRKSQDGLTIEEYSVTLSIKQ